MRAPVELPLALTHDLHVADLREVEGGSIAQVYRLRVGPRTIFAKTLIGAPQGFFDRETIGLRALRETGTVLVPTVLRHTSVGLLLEWIPHEQVSPSNAAAAERFGRELAGLHNSHGTHFGSVEDVPVGFLGSVALDLQPEASYDASYLHRRVEPLTREAVARDRLDPAALGLVERLIASGPDLCGPPEPPALVHGDLWSGNRVIADDGQHWLVDPSAHYGHREYDLALMRLLGGFEDRVFAAYAEVSPLSQGWHERLDLHQLVPLLINALMFQEVYARQVMSRLRRLAR
ncbi:MAG: fructosamine kinase family protein [Ornithinimicrobium sp.]